MPDESTIAILRRLRAKRARINAGVRKVDRSARNANFTAGIKGDAAERRRASEEYGASLTMEAQLMNKTRRPKR